MAGHCRDALAAVIREAAELIVLDLRLPVLDGIGFMKVLRSYIRWSHIPVVVVTALQDEIEIARVTSFGVHRVFRKANYQLADLVTSVREILPAA